MPTRPRWLRSWPWFWDPRKTPRASRDALQASDDTLERLQRAAADARDADCRREYSEPMLERLRRLLERLGGG
jgi:hypothetical protein